MRRGICVVGVLLLSACAGRASVEAKSPRTDVAAVSPPQQPAPQEILFARKGDAAGATRAAHATSSTSIVYGRDGRTRRYITDLHVAEDENVREEVLAADAGYPTKLRVTFGARKVIRIHDGRETRRDSAVAGKSYVVEGHEGGVTVTDAAGARVSDPEAQLVSGRYWQLAERTMATPEIAPRPLHAGDRVDQLDAFVRREIARTAEGRFAFHQVQVEFTGARDVGGVACAAFDVAVDAFVGMGSESGIGTRRWLGGELVLRASDGAPVSLTLEGPVLVTTHTTTAYMRGWTLDGWDYGEGTAKLDVRWDSR